MKTKLLIIALLLTASPLLAHAQTTTDTYISSSNITVGMNFTDPVGLGWMTFRLTEQGEWTDNVIYSSSFDLILPNFGADGEYCIWAKVSDALEPPNWTLPIKACAWLKTTPPTGGCGIRGFKVTTNTKTTTEFFINP